MKNQQKHDVVTTLKGIDSSLKRIAESAEALVSLSFTVAQVWLAQQEAKTGISSGEDRILSISSAQEQIEKHLAEQRARLEGKRNG